MATNIIHVCTILYQYNVQDANDPDKSTMWHFKQFTNAEDAVIWYGANKKLWSKHKVFGCEVELVTTIKPL